MPIPEPAHLVGVEKVCPRCGSTAIKWRYYNNAKTTQPRYLCKTCNHEFTYAGKIRPSKKRKMLEARKAALTMAREAAEQAAALVRAKEVAEQAALDAAAQEVAKRIARKTKKAAKVAKAAKRAAKAARKVDKAAKRAAKRAARELVHLAAQDQLDGSKSDMLQPTASAASSKGEMMPAGQKMSSGLPADRACEFVSQVVDGVHVVEHVDDGFDDALILPSSGLDSWVGDAEEVDAARSLSELSRVDGAGHLDSGKMTLFDQLWAEHGGEIDSGLAWLPDSRGDGSAEVDTRLASWSKNCGGGGWVDCGLGGSEVQRDACGSAGLEADLEVVDFMMTRYGDIDSGLEWMSDSGGTGGSALGDSGVGGFEMWIGPEPAESEADLDSADLVITGLEMEGLAL